jgi:Tol biopolymer transport system component
VFDMALATGQIPRWRVQLGRAVTVRRLRLASVVTAAGLLAVWLVAIGLDRATAPGPRDVPRQAGLLAFLRDGDVYLAGPDGAGEVRVLHADGVSFQSVAWSPTRDLLAVGTSQAVFVLDPATLGVRRLATGRFAAWSPDGLFIALVDSTAEWVDGSDLVRIVWVADGRTNLEIRTPPGSPMSAATWSPDGRWLAASTSRYVLRFDVRTGLTAQIAQLTRSYYTTAAPAWSPDSRRLAYVDWRATGDGATVGSECTNECTATIVTIGVDGSDPTDLYAESAMQTDPVWSPDGSSIAYMGRPGSTNGPGWLSVMRIGEAKPRLLLEGSIDAFAWSPDGASITIERQTDQFDTRPTWTLSTVSVADGSERGPAVAQVDAGFSWQSLATGSATASLPTPTGSTGPALTPEPLASPAPARPATPSAWSGIAFDMSVSDGAGSECINAVTRSLAPRKTIVTKSFCGENFNQGQWAPNGSVYAAMTDGHLAMVSRAGKVREVPGVSGPDGVFWSPDSRWLAARSCQPQPDFRPSFTPPVCSWSLVTPDGSSTRAIAGSPSWSADGTHLLLGLPDGRVTVGRGDGSASTTIDVLPASSSLSPDGTSAAFVRDGDAWIVSLPDGTPRNITRFDFGGVYAAEWSPDGRWILAVRDRDVWILRVDGEERRPISLGSSMNVGGWRWAPDGRHLAITGWSPDTGTPTAMIVSIDGSPTILLDGADNPLWSPDGQFLAINARGPDGNPTGLDIVAADGSGRTTVWTGSGNNLPQAWVR